MKRFRQVQNQQKDVDVSPILDMVFILLIFFMVSTTFVKDMKIDLDRPGASSGETSSGKAVRIYIDKGENLFMDGQPVRSWVLQGKVRDKVRSKKETSILIVTDKSVSADKLVEVVDLCRLAGAKDIGVATQTEMGS